MTKQTLEKIAAMVEGLLTANRSIVSSKPNHIAFLPVLLNADTKSMRALLDIATALTNNAISRGFSDLDALRKALAGADKIPDEAFEVERTRFKIGCFVYKKENQSHLIIFGK